MVDFCHKLHITTKGELISMKNMKKVSLLIIAISTIVSAQLRVGIDMSRDMSMGGALGSLLGDVEIEGTGLTIGYEQTLLSLAGVGAEYTMGGDEGLDMFYTYAVAKIPVGLPMFRGIARAGYSIPLGDGGDEYDAGLAYGIGLRFKLPLFPIGAEAQYTIHNLEMKDDGDLGDLLDDLGMTYKVMNLTVTYSF